MKKARSRGKPQEFDPQQPPEIPGVTDLTLIGRGGSASVYKGHETAMNRNVAVKVLHTQLREADEQQAFKLECEHAGEVGEHPYAADVYRNGFADGWPFLLMRYYARGSLAGTLRFAGQQQVGDTLTTCANIATALQYAHDLGILHRDVKPENILCGAYGAPVLADFGIATDRDAATRTLRHAMTPAYAAPEVLQHGGGWPHSDVWSLAATLYALLAGHPPFYDSRQGNPQANLRALVGPLPPVGRPGVPGHVLETLARALIGRPDTRTASARRFAEELNADLKLLGLPPVQIGVDGHAAAGAPPLVHPDPVAPPSPVIGSGSSAAPYATQSGFTTTTAPASFALGHATRPPGPPAPPQAQGAQWPQVFEPTGTMTGLQTGYVSTQHAYRQPGQPGHRAAGKRKRVPKAAMAGSGGALVLVVLAVAYLLAAPKHPPASTAASTPVTSAPATSTASASADGNAAATILPPQDVSAVALNDTSVRLSWTNAGSHAHDSQVIVSMGSGYDPRPLPNQSPQVITGLNPMQPYCFAVGYYVGSGSVNVAYSKITTKACIRGGKPAPAG